jgi:hypothetical protein
MRHGGEGEVGSEGLQRVLDVERGAGVAHSGGCVRQLQRAFGRSTRRKSRAFALQRAAHARQQLGEPQRNRRPPQPVQLLRQPDQLESSHTDVAMTERRCVIFHANCGLNTKYSKHLHSPLSSPK